MSLPENTTPAGLDGSGVLGDVEDKPLDQEVHAHQQAALLAFSRRSNAQPELPILMQDAVALVAEILKGEFGGVGEVQGGGTMLTLRVAQTDEQSRPVDPVVRKSSLDPATSMAGYALRTASPVISTDLAAEKRFADLFLRKLGIVSALTVPLQVNCKPFGIVGVYTRKKRVFTLEDVRFSETIVHLLTSSIARLKAEEQLQDQRRFASTVLDMVDTLVLTLDLDGNVVDMNEACQQVTGFSLEEAAHKPFWDLFVVPGEIEVVRGIFRSSRIDKVPCEFEGYLRAKDDSRRRVAWSLKAMCDGRVQSIILTGVDQTKLIETAAELQRAKEVAKEAAEALKEVHIKTDVGDHPDSPPAVPGEDAPGEEPSGDARDEKLQPFRVVQGNAGQELRTSPRRAYQFTQMIAPRYDDAIPSPKAFIQIECNDISAGGISFYLDQLPDFEDLVVALGQPPTLTHFAARVVRVAGVEQNDQKRYFVGCRFIGRLHL